MVLWTQRPRKFSSPTPRPGWMARAVAGMVVSKPTPKKTRCLSGVLPGQFHRVQGGSRPPAPRPPGPAGPPGRCGVPGTRSMSPKEIRITPGSSPRARKASRSDWSVTHTGQPGPEMSCTPGGRRDLRPKRAAAMVWVPQTSMMVAGPSKAARPQMRRTSSCTSSWSRNSSINFIGQGPQQGEGFLGIVSASTRAMASPA